MPAFLGNPDYSPVKGYAEIQSDFSTINTTVVVTEGKVIKSGDDYIICVIANSITDLWKAESFIPDTKVCCVIHANEYTRYTKENPKTPTQVTQLEKVFKSYFDGDGSMWLEKSFLGRFQLNSSEITLEVAQESKKWDLIARFVECEPRLIKDLEVKSGGQAKRFNNGSQTEFQRLSDRQLYLIESAGVFASEAKNMTDLVFGLIAMKTESPDVFSMYMQLIKVVLGSNDE